MVAELEHVETIVLTPETRTGRPTIRTEANRNAILEAMRMDGLAVSRAAEAIGISKQSVSEWKIADPDFADAVTRAEAEYLKDRMSNLRACRTKWNTPDPKALELELRRFPEFRQHQETTSTNLNLNLTAQLSPERMAEMQARHRASLERLK